MENSEFEKSKAFLIAEILEYAPHSVVTKTISSKPTGHICAIAFDSGQTLPTNISRFETFIQIVDGKAEIVIDDQSHCLETGQSIIIPAHSRNTIKANERFKMLTTTIKSGYEEAI